MIPETRFPIGCDSIALFANRFPWQSAAERQRAYERLFQAVNENVAMITPPPPPRYADDPTKQKRNTMKKYFGEKCLYTMTMEDRNEAVTYLKLWKKFMLRNLKDKGFKFKFIDESFQERDSDTPSNRWLSLKVCLEITLPFELTEADQE